MYFHSKINILSIYYIESQIYCHRNLSHGRTTETTIITINNFDVLKCISESDKYGNPQF